MVKIMVTIAEIRSEMVCCRYEIGKIMLTPDLAPHTGRPSGELAPPSGVLHALQVPPGPVSPRLYNSLSRTLFTPPHFARFPLLEPRFPVGDVW